jgi:hypothetical protein
LAWHVNRSLNYIFVILTPRAIDWYITESILRGPKGGGDRGILGGLQNFTGLLSARGVWYLITEMHGMPPRRPRGCFQQITSNWFQNCNSRIALCISCMNEVKRA